MPADIAIFARAPVPGEAKTRLVPQLGAEGAARLQRELIRAALAKAIAVPGARTTLWVAGDAGHPFLVECARDAGVPIREQRGADLGARMDAAFADTLTGPKARCVLVGTDCPALATTDLVAALDALATHDVVVQPAEDGGYVLIGLRAPQPALFAGIDWGTDTVMAATRARIRAASLKALERPTLPDLDTPADYARAIAAGWIRG